MQQTRGLAQRLHWAIGANDLQEVRAALAAGADPNVEDRDTEEPPLVRAAWWSGRSRVEIVRLLLKHGARTNQPAREHPLVIACHNLPATADVVRVLLERPLEPATLSEALRRAAVRESPDILRALVQRGAVVDAQEIGATETALMNAAGSGARENVRTLLELGADPTLQDGDDRTASWHAAQARDPEIMRMISRAVQQRR